MNDIDDFDDDEPMIFSQLGLVAAIGEHLDRCKVDLNVRQYNAVIRAADGIVAALAEPHRPATPGMGYFEWQQCDETGRSSILLGRRLYASTLGEALDEFDPRDYPRDAGDFGRCLGLLDAEPVFRRHLAAAADLGPQWAAIVANWDAIEADCRAGRNAEATRRIVELTGGNPA